MEGPIPSHLEMGKKIDIDVKSDLFFYLKLAKTAITFGFESGLLCNWKAGFI